MGHIKVTRKGSVLRLYGQAAGKCTPRFLACQGVTSPVVFACRLSVDRTSSPCEIKGLRARRPCPTRPRYAMLQSEFVPQFILSILAVIRVFFRTRGDTPRMFSPFNSRSLS